MSLIAPMWLILENIESVPGLACFTLTTDVANPSEHRTMISTCLCARQNSHTNLCRSASELERLGELQICQVHIFLAFLLRITPLSCLL